LDNYYKNKVGLFKLTELYDQYSNDLRLYEKLNVNL